MMATPYAALLSVRRVEEREAEVRFAKALHDVREVEAQLANLHAIRQAWLAQGPEPLGESGAAGFGTVGLAGALDAVERAERDATRRLIEAQRRAEQARLALFERQRQRKVVEKLHAQALATAARAEARRAQITLDELGSRTSSHSPSVRPG